MVQLLTNVQCEDSVRATGSLVHLSGSGDPGCVASL